MSTKPTFKPPLAVPGDITETSDLQGAYPRLSDAQIAALTGQGDRRRTQPGEILFAEGERDCDFYVVLAGNVASVEGHGTHEQRVISVHGRGRFLGELSLLTGEGSFYTAMALDAGEVLAVPAAGQGTGRSRPGIRRPRPARLPAAPFDSYRARRRPASGRLAVLTRHPAGPRLRGQEPDPGPVARPGDRPGRRGHARAVRRDTRRHPGRGRLRAPAPQPRQRRTGRRDRTPGAGRAAGRCDMLVVGAGRPGLSLPCTPRQRACR